MTLKLRKQFIIVMCFSISFAFIGCFEMQLDGNNKQGLQYDIYVNDDYDSKTPGWGVDHFNAIADAVNASKENGLIFVYSGIYFEPLTINKKITLIGENAKTTVISGEQCEDDIIHVDGDGGTIISGFTIKNNGNQEGHNYDKAGIDIRSSGNTIKENIFINNTCGIYTKYAHNNQVIGNKFIDNHEYGVHFHSGSNDNNISNNIFINNRCALRIKGNENCIVQYNVFMNNTQGLYFCCGANYNIAYGNIFYNNSEWDASDKYNNAWDIGSIPSSWYHNDKLKIGKNTIDNISIGNFWGSYHLESQGAYDNNSDGIIDTPYDIPEAYTDDNYPLLEPPTINNPFFKMEDLHIE